MTVGIRETPITLRLGLRNQVTRLLTNFERSVGDVVVRLSWRTISPTLLFSTRLPSNRDFSNEFIAYFLYDAYREHRY